MTVSPSRRHLLLGLLAAGASACGASAAAPTVPASLASTWQVPAETGGGLVAFLLPGLGATDLLLAANEGEAPNAETMIRRGTLIDTIDPESGTIYSEEELGQALLATWSADTVIVPCLNWQHPPAAAGDTAACGDDLAARWRALAEGALAAATAGSAVVLVADSGLLALEAATLLADERQSGYSVAAAEESLRAVRAAVKALDAALGLLLGGLDLGAWTVALLSDSEVWPAYAVLDPSAAGASGVRLYDGGAIMQAGAAVTLPETEDWAGAQVGVGPDGSGAARVLAPAGRVFAAAGMSPPRATPHAGGFLLAVGGGVGGGVRLSPSSPPQVARYLARLAGQEQAATP